MRRHVNHMAGGRHQRTQSIRAPLGAIGIVGRFDQMNVVVQRTGVIGIPRDRPLERIEDACRLRLRGAILLPVVPRHRVHRRVGIQRLDVGVVRILPCHRLHGGGIRAIQRRPIAHACRRVARRQRLDQRPLAGSDLRRRGTRGLDRCVRRAAVVGGHRRIEIRTERQRLAPIRHRQRRIEPCCLTERADRFSVIERIQQPHALIEEPLGPRRCR